MLLAEHFNFWQYLYQTLLHRHLFNNIFYEGDYDWSQLSVEFHATYLTSNQNK